MILFPIGDLSASVNTGAISGINYSFFEPNKGCFSKRQYYNLSTKFELVTMLTRKKAEPTLFIEYDFEDIYSKEFRQVEAFVDYMDGSLTSFWMVDLSKGTSPSSVTDSGSDWVATIDDTSLYSTVANQKATHTFFWHRGKYKEGAVLSISTNTSITVDVDTDNFGALSLSDANLHAMVYPMYQVYFTENTLDNFKVTNYLEDSITLSKSGGNLYSGTLSAVTKYKV